MIFLGIICLIFTTYVMISISKKNNTKLILFWLGIITIFILLVGSSESKLSNIENKINNHKQQIIEIKAEQYDIKDEDTKKYKENEKELINLYIKHNDKVSKYNNILKKDKEKFILFRWHFNAKEIDNYPLEITTEFIAPDFYRS